MPKIFFSTLNGLELIYFPVIDSLCLLFGSPLSPLCLPGFRGGIPNPFRTKCEGIELEQGFQPKKTVFGYRNRPFVTPISEARPKFDPAPSQKSATGRPGTLYLRWSAIAGRTRQYADGDPLRVCAGVATDT